MNKLILAKERQLSFDDLYDVYDMIMRGILIPGNDEKAVVNMYFESAAISSSIPDVENIATRVDDANSSFIYEICFTLGLSEVEVDFVMGKYCHEIAADLDISITKALDKYNLSYVCDGEVVLGENVLPCQNILFSKWDT